MQTQWQWRYSKFIWFMSQREGKRTDIKSYLVEWYIKQLWVKTLDNTYNLYKKPDSINFFLNWRTNSHRLWKGTFFLNYQVIFSTPILLYNQKWSKHCTSIHNRKWIQQNYDCMDPRLQKGVRNENGKCARWTWAGF